jgi:uncharacterized protein YjiS (DUF1127 family)
MVRQRRGERHRPWSQTNIIVENKIMIAQDRLVSRHATSAIGQAAKMLGSALAAGWQRWRNRRDIERLLRVSDRELADIGLQRSDVERALMTDWRQDASARLADIRDERRRAMQRRRELYTRSRHTKMTL